MRKLFSWHILNFFAQCSFAVFHIRLTPRFTKKIQTALMKESFFSFLSNIKIIYPEEHRYGD